MAPCRETPNGPEMPVSLGTGPFEHDVRRGSIVSLKMYYPFERPCRGRSITIEAIYKRGGTFGPPGEPGSTLVGTATVTQPPGTQGTPPGRH